MAVSRFLIDSESETLQMAKTALRVKTMQIRTHKTLHWRGLRSTRSGGGVGLAMALFSAGLFDNKRHIPQRFRLGAEWRLDSTVIGGVGANAVDDVTFVRAPVAERLAVV